MKEELIEEILSAIVPSLQSAETQTAALVQLLREKNVISAEERARLQEQAANTADIKALAMRLLTSALQELEASKAPEKPAEPPKSQPKPEGPETSADAEQEKYHQPSEPENQQASA